LTLQLWDDKAVVEASFKPKTPNVVILEPETMIPRRKRKFMAEPDTNSGSDADADADAHAIITPKPVGKGKAKAIDPPEHLDEDPAPKRSTRMRKKVLNPRLVPTPQA